MSCSIGRTVNRAFPLQTKFSCMPLVFVFHLSIVLCFRYSAGFFFCWLTCSRIPGDRGGRAGSHDVVRAG